MENSKVPLSQHLAQETLDSKVYLSSAVYMCKLQHAHSFKLRILLNKRLNRGRRSNIFIKVETRRTADVERGLSVNVFHLIFDE